MSDGLNTTLNIPPWAKALLMQVLGFAVFYFAFKAGDAILLITIKLLLMVLSVGLIYYGYRMQRKMKNLIETDN